MEGSAGVTSGRMHIEGGGSPGVGIPALPTDPEQTSEQGRLTDAVGINQAWRDQLEKERADLQRAIENLEAELYHKRVRESACGAALEHLQASEKNAPAPLGG